MKTMKKALAVMLAMIMALGVFSLSALAEDDESTASGEAITFVDVTIELPEPEVYPTNYHALGSEAYELVDLTWTDAETDEIVFSSFAESLIETKPFVDGKVYTVTLTLYAAQGYVFDLENTVVSVNGYVAEIEEINIMGKRLVATCDFECKEDIIDIGGDGTSNAVFDQILGFLKTLLLTFVRFVGSIFGIG